MPNQQLRFSQESNASTTISPDRFSDNEPEFHDDDDENDNDQRNDQRNATTSSVFVSVESVPYKPTLPALLSKPGAFIRSNGPVKMPTLPPVSKKTGITKKIAADIKKTINMANQRINALQGAVDSHYTHTSTIYKAAKGVIDEAWTMLSKRQKEHAKDAKLLAKERNNNVAMKNELQSKKQDLTVAKAATVRAEGKLATMTARAKRFEEAVASNKTPLASGRAASRSGRSAEEEVAFLREKADIDVEKRLRINMIAAKEKEQAEKNKKKAKTDRFSNARWGALQVTNGGQFQQRQERRRSSSRSRSRSHRRRSSRHRRSRSRSCDRSHRRRRSRSRSRDRSYSRHRSDDDSYYSRRSSGYHSRRSPSRAARSQSRYPEDNRSRYPEDNRSRCPEDNRRNDWQSSYGQSPEVDNRSQSPGNERQSSRDRSYDEQQSSRDRSYDHQSRDHQSLSDRLSSRHPNNFIPPHLTGRDEAQRRYHQEQLRQQTRGHRPVPPQEITAEGSQVAEELTVGNDLPLVQPYDLPRPDLDPALAMAVDARPFITENNGTSATLVSESAAELLLGMSTRSSSHNPLSQ